MPLAMKQANGSQVDFIVRLPRPLHTKAKKKSKKLGIPLSVIVRVKLQEWVEQKAEAA